MMSVGCVIALGSSSSRQAIRKGVFGWCGGSLSLLATVYMVCAMVCLQERTLSYNSNNLIKFL